MTTNNAVNTSLSGQTGTGSFAGSTSPTFITPTLGAASGTSLAFSSTSGIIGTTTNNNAAAGSVGELISSVVLSSGAVGISNATATDITSIVLTAGDWDVWGNLHILGGTTNTLFVCWISSTSATVPDSSLYSQLSIPGASQWASPTPTLRFSVATTATIYLDGYIAYTGGSASANGGIYARRVR